MEWQVENHHRLVQLISCMWRLTISTPVYWRPSRSPNSALPMAIFWFTCDSKANPVEDQPFEYTKVCLKSEGFKLCWINASSAHGFTHRLRHVYWAHVLDAISTIPLSNCIFLLHLQQRYKKFSITISQREIYLPLFTIYLLPEELWDFRLRRSSWG